MIVIIDYGMGNVGAIKNMLHKIGAQAKISASPSELKRANKLILPGVGAFGTGSKNLMQMGLRDVLLDCVRVDRKPILGICLGMQLLTDSSEEGSGQGLGLLEARTVRFQFDLLETRLKIPHMGWNKVKLQKKNPLFQGLEDDNRFYFVHSFHVQCLDKNQVLGSTWYGYEFTAAVASGNVLGVQFHPEKSHQFGLKLLSNFVEHIKC